MCDRHRRHGANATPSIFQAPQRPAMHDTTSATARHRREVFGGSTVGLGRATASAVAGAATPERKASLRQRTRARIVINVNAESIYFKMLRNDQRARARAACASVGPNGANDRRPSTGAVIQPGLFQVRAPTARLSPVRYVTAPGSACTFISRWTTSSLSLGSSTFKLLIWREATILANCDHLVDRILAFLCKRFGLGRISPRDSLVETTEHDQHIRPDPVPLDSASATGR